MAVLGLFFTTVCIEPGRSDQDSSGIGGIGGTTRPKSLSRGRLEAVESRKSSLNS
jgi:hypothetical protein